MNYCIDFFFCKHTPSTSWLVYLEKAVWVHIFCKRREGLASGDVTLPHILKATFSNPGFPTGYMKWVRRVVCGPVRCRTLLPGMCSLASPCQKQQLRMIALETGGEKAAGKIILFLNTCKQLVYSFTHGNSFSPRVSDMSCHRENIVKARFPGFPALAPWSKFQSTTTLCVLSSSHPTSHTTPPNINGKADLQLLSNGVAPWQIQWLLPACKAVSLTLYLVQAWNRLEQRKTLTLIFEQETFLARVNGHSSHYWKYFLSSLHHAWPDNSSESYFCL